MKVQDFIGTKASYCNSVQMIFGNGNNGEQQLLLNVRGWGAIQNLFKNKDGTIRFGEAEKFQDELGMWITDAINKKLKEIVN